MADSLGRGSSAHEDWTMVSSKGEILSEDAASESSESSIEIVDVDSDQGISSHSSSQGKKDNVVAEKDSSSADFSQELQEESISVAEPGPGLIVSNNSPLDAESTCDETHPVQQATPDDSSFKAEEQKLEVTGLDVTVEDTKDSEIELAVSIDNAAKEAQIESVNDMTQENEPVRPRTDEGNASLKVLDDECVTSKSIPQESSTATDSAVSLSAGENSSTIQQCLDEEGDSAIEAREVIKDGTTNTEERSVETSLGACCAELLADSSLTDVRDTLESGNTNLTDPVDAAGPCPVSEGESKMSHISGQDIIVSDGQGARSESDSDSDFICLDPHLPEDLENVSYAISHESSEERVLIPLRLSRSNSSIGPGFNFMRDDPGPPAPRAEEEVDEDRDDDTESSTEEGIDDRIESEQSEAGSDPQSNDVGDLSSFGDIGDLPLIAGNVPRNYIHRPNQDLTTILNVILVLAAFLTMGLSLGIMMATDLEIEEWQNAYELQTKRVADLEGQMKELRLDMERERRMKEAVQGNKGRTMDELMQDIEDKQMRKWVRENEERKMTKLMQDIEKVETLQALVDQRTKELQQAERDHKGFVEAFHVMAYYDEDQDFAALVKSFRSVVEAVSSCNVPGRTGWLKAPFCYMDKQEKIAELKTHIKAYSDSHNLLQSSFPDVREEEGAQSTEDEEEVSQETNETEMIKDEAQEDEEILVGSEDPSQTHLSSQVSAAEHSDLVSDEESLEMSQVQEQPEIVEESDRAGEAMPSSKTEKVHGTTGHHISSIAQDIPLDIKQLQQSLSLEQERALYWQQLYLAERRQREHERENEMWEDQRDRERWEQEREQAERVECLQKLMETNLTTLTQYLTRWNVSVYDDFANLSMLMSSVAELRKSVVDSVHRVVDGAEEIFEKIRQDGKESFGSEYWGASLPARDMIIKYVNQLFKDVGEGVNHVIEESNEWEEELKDDTEAFKKRGKTSVEDDDDDREYRSSFDHQTEEEESGKRKGHTNTKWTQGFERFLHKTRKSVGKLGKKMTSVVRRLQDMWIKKKPKIASLAKDFSSRIVRITEKFMKHLSKGLNLELFKENWKSEKNEVVKGIHSKEVKALRQKWQEQVLRYPCTTVGDYSAECNMSKKERKRRIKAINRDFNKLLGMQTDIGPYKEFLKRIHKVNTREVKMRFGSFLKDWPDSKLLLKSDNEWVECQFLWWYHLDSHSIEGDERHYHGNTCNEDLASVVADKNKWQSLKDEHFPQGEAESEVCFIANAKSKIDDDDDDDGDDDDDEKEGKTENCFTDGICQKKVHSEEELVDDARDHEGQEDEMKAVEVEAVELAQMPQLEDAFLELEEDLTESNDSHIQPVPSNLPSRDDYTWKQGLAGGFYAQSKGDEGRQESGKFLQHNSGFWMFEKAKDRQRQREEAERSGWQFERARGRRHDSFHASHYKRNVYKRSEEDFDDDDDTDDDDDYENDDAFEQLANWYLEQARERQRLRKEEHQSDWLFERASNRRKEHHLWKDHSRKGHGHHKAPPKGDKHSRHQKHLHRNSHGKQHFRHSYGKVVTP